MALTRTHLCPRSHAHIRFELLMLEWVVVLLNCLCIIFPYILELMDLGLAGTFELLTHSMSTPEQVECNVFASLSFSLSIPRMFSLCLSFSRSFVPPPPLPSLSLGLLL